MVTNAHHIINSTLTGSRSPAGRDRLRDSDAHKHIAVPRLSAFFGRTPDQDPKAAKYAILTPGPGMFVNVWKRSEGSDTTPIQNTPVSACVPFVCDFSLKGECYPAFGSETNVGRLCEKLKNGMRSGLR